MAEQTESVILEFEVDESEAVESIDNLTKANKELRKERNALNLQSAEGKKRATEINALVDQNTEKIKNNVSALEKQKINIGNYKSALDGVVPGLGRVGEGLEAGASGFKAMTMQALRFIATPIGAILAAIVAVFSLLKAAVSSNNEVLDKFENITNAIGIIVEIITNRIGKLGEALVALASGDFSGAIDKTKEAFGGLGDEIARAVDEGQRLLDLSRDLEDAQRDLTVATAKQENVIKALVVSAKNRNLTLDEQEAKLRRALKLEEELVKERERLALIDLEVTAGNIANTEAISKAADESVEAFANRLRKMSTLSDEQIDPLIEKIVALEQARGGSLAFQEKVENQLAAIAEKRAEALRKLNEQLAEQAALEAANRRAQSGDPTSPTEDPLIGAFQTRAKVITDIETKMLSESAIRKDAAQQEDIRRAKEGAALEVAVERQKFAMMGNALGQFAALAEEDSVEHKILASAQALINTYLAATAALASGSEINPVFGIISAAAAIATGLASVAQINGVQFADGGIVLRGPSHAQGGIPIEAEGNEIIMTKGVYNNPNLRAQASAINVAGGGRSFADGGLVSNSITAPVNQQLEIMNIIKAMPAPVVAVKEINRVQKRVRVKEQISQR